MSACLVALAFSLAATNPVDVVPHPLLACSESWIPYREVVTQVSIGGTVCSVAAFGATEDLSRAFVRSLEMLAFGWDDIHWAFGNPMHMQVMQANPAEKLLNAPCLFGWLTAYCCLLRPMHEAALGLIRDELVFDELNRALELWDVVPETFRMFMYTLYGAERWQAPGQQDLPESSAMLLQLLRDLGSTDEHSATVELEVVARAMVLGYQRHAILLPSSGWPVSVSEVARLTRGGVRSKEVRHEPIPPWPDEHDEEEVQRWLQRPPLHALCARCREPRLAEPPTQLRVWGISFHRSLLLELGNVWQDLFRMARFQIATHWYLGEGSCDGAIGCTEQSPMLELLRGNLDRSAFSKTGTRFPKFRSCNEAFLEAVGTAARHDPALNAADAIVVGEPPVLMWFLHEHVREKPMAGYLGNPLGAYLTEGFQKQFLEQLIAWAEDPDVLVQPVFNSPWHAAQARWSTGVVYPAVRSVGRYTGVSHSPRTRDVLVSKMKATCFWDFPLLLNRALPEADFAFRAIKELQDTSWQSWAGFRAAVLLPYEPALMTFYELYGMGMPLLVPADELLPSFLFTAYSLLPDHGAMQVFELAKDRRGAAWGDWYGHDFGPLLWWTKLSDAATMPHTLRWLSFADLVGHLAAEDRLAEAARRTQAHATRLYAQSVLFWYQLLLRFVPAA